MSTISRSFFGSALLFLGLLFLKPALLHGQTWNAVWRENFNNATYESCYTTLASTYWANCASPTAGPRNSLINGTWEVANTNLGATQSPSNSSGGRFLMYWSDGGFNSGNAVPATDTIVFTKSLTGLTIGRTYRVSFKFGALLQTPGTTLSNAPLVGLRLNNASVLNWQAATTSWVSRSYTWVATTTTATLQWTNGRSNTSGNDLALDDLLVEVASTNPLPVTLLDFTAVQESGCRVALGWHTAHEQNLEAFIVERSADGRAFGQLQKVPATGAGSYRFSDDVHNSTCYYRLRMVDMDGTDKLSAVQMITVRCGTPGNDIRLYPVPASGDLYISNVPDGARIGLYDIGGRLLMEDIAAATTAHLDLRRFVPGTYWVKIIAGSTVTTARMIKE